MTPKPKWKLLGQISTTRWLWQSVRYPRTFTAMFDGADPNQHYAPQRFRVRPKESMATAAARVYGFNGLLVNGRSFRIGCNSFTVGKATAFLKKHKIKIPLLPKPKKAKAK